MQDPERARRGRIRSETSSKREPVVFVANYKEKDGEAWRCLDSAGIHARAGYRMPLWIKLETEPQLFLID